MYRLGVWPNPLDAVTDAINKLLDKAQEVAPTVWAAALHQVAINARMSFFWGIGWTVVGGLFLLIALGIPVLYFNERRQFRKATDAVLQLSASPQTAMTTYQQQQQLDKIRYDANPNQNLPFTAWASVVAWIIVVLCAIMAVISYWNAWQMAQNPTWFAIQLLKG